MRILIIDDSVDDITLIRRELEDAKHTVIAARRVETGLALARRYAPQAIVCDIMMPGGESGFDLFRRVKEDEDLRHIPVIALTGAHPESDDYIRAESEFDGVISKNDFSAEKLNEKVSQHRNGKPRHRRLKDDPLAETRPFKPVAQESIELSTPAGSIKAHGVSLLPLITALGIVGIAIVIHFQGEDQKSAQAAVVESNVAMSKALGELVRATRFSACILATDQDRRGQEYMNQNSYCNRHAQ